MNKDPFPKIAHHFQMAHGALGLQVLEALAEGCERRPGQNEIEEVELDTLVQIASRHAATRDLYRPLDQKRARAAAITLFRQFEEARLGKLIEGRRKHRTRFRFAWPAGSDDQARGIGGLRQALADLRVEIPRPSDGFRTSRESGGDTASVDAERPRKKDIVSKLKAKSDELHRLGIDTLALFGSVARDDARPDSDVDLLATFGKGVTSEAFFDAKFFLEDLLGRRIDLVTADALRERVRSTIERELIRVA